MCRIGPYNVNYTDQFCTYTAELHLSGLIVKASHPDMQKIRIIGFFLKNRLQWQFEVGEKILKTAVLGKAFIYVQIKH